MNSLKHTNSISANLIQNVDAFIIIRLFSLFRKFYLPGVGVPILPVYDSLSLPFSFYNEVMKLYRYVNYDIFCSGGNAQDILENYPNSFFKMKPGQSLIEVYFEHFLEDLKLQIGHFKEGQEALKEFKEDLENTLKEMKKKPDYAEFDYQIFHDAMFMKL